MKFLADENLEGPIVHRLRAAGYDVLWVLEERPRASDPAVLALAGSEQRILLTNDKDFAELTFLRRIASVGIVLVRLPALRSEEKAGRLLAVIDQVGEGLAGWYTVITPRGTRRRQLPSLLQPPGQE